MRHTGFNIEAAALETLVVNMAETLSSIPPNFLPLDLCRNRMGGNRGAL